MIRVFPVKRKMAVALRYAINRRIIRIMQAKLCGRAFSVIQGMANEKITRLPVTTTKLRSAIIINCKLCFSLMKNNYISHIIHELQNIYFSEQNMN